MKIKKGYENKGIDCGRLVSNYEDRVWETGRRDKWNLILTNSGTLSVATEFGTFEAHDGDLILCAPSSRRCFSITKEVEWSALWFHLDLHIPLCWEEGQKGLFFFHPDAKLFHRLWQDAWEAYTLGRLIPENWLPLASNLLENIIYRGNMQCQSKNVDPQIKECVLFLSEQDTMPDINVLAQKAGICRTKFFKMFRQSYGTTPRSYYETMKLNHVRDMAVNTTLPFSEIAEFCGFPNLFYLSKRFKKVYHLSLSEYRKQSHQGSVNSNMKK